MKAVSAANWGRFLCHVKAFLTWIEENYIGGSHIWTRDDRGSISDVCFSRTPVTKSVWTVWILTDSVHIKPTSKCLWIIMCKRNNWNITILHLFLQHLWDGKPAAEPFYLQFRSHINYNFEVIYPLIRSHFTHVCFFGPHALCHFTICFIE